MQLGVGRNSPEAVSNHPSISMFVIGFGISIFNRYKTTYEYVYCVYLTVFQLFLCVHCNDNTKFSLKHIRYKVLHCD